MCEYSAGLLSMHYNASFVPPKLIAPNIAILTNSISQCLLCTGKEKYGTVQICPEMLYSSACNADSSDVIAGVREFVLNISAGVGSQAALGGG